jgi:hypothetical protein
MKKLTRKHLRKLIMEAFEPDAMEKPEENMGDDDRVAVQLEKDFTIEKLGNTINIGLDNQGYENTPIAYFHYKSGKVYLNFGKGQYKEVILKSVPNKQDIPEMTVGKEFRIAGDHPN